jgi:hypothetical protein
MMSGLFQGGFEKGHGAASQSSLEGVETIRRWGPWNRCVELGFYEFEC